MIIVWLNYCGIVEWLVNAIDSQNLSLKMPSHNYHPWKSSKCLDTECALHCCRLCMSMFTQ